MAKITGDSVGGSQELCYNEKDGIDVWPDAAFGGIAGALAAYTRSLRQEIRATKRN